MSPVINPFSYLSLSVKDHKTPKSATRISNKKRNSQTRKATANISLFLSSYVAFPYFDILANVTWDTLYITRNEFSHGEILLQLTFRFRQHAWRLVGAGHCATTDPSMNPPLLRVQCHNTNCYQEMDNGGAFYCRSILAG